jgi:hypothetical protein
MLNGMLSLYQSLAEELTGAGEEKSWKNEMFIEVDVLLCKYFFYIVLALH